MREKVAPKAKSDACRINISITASFPYKFSVVNKLVRL